VNSAIAVGWAHPSLPGAHLLHLYHPCAKAGPSLPCTATNAHACPSHPPAARTDSIATALGGQVRASSRTVTRTDLAPSGRCRALPAQSSPQLHIRCGGPVHALRRVPPLQQRTCTWACRTRPSRALLTQSLPSVTRCVQGSARTLTIRRTDPALRGCRQAGSPCTP
jgi:hypothetical protein